MSLKPYYEILPLSELTQQVLIALKTGVDYNKYKVPMHRVYECTPPTFVASRKVAIEINEIHAQLNEMCDGGHGELGANWVLVVATKLENVPLDDLLALQCHIKLMGMPASSIFSVSLLTTQQLLFLFKDKAEAMKFQLKYA